MPFPPARKIRWISRIKRALRVLAPAGTAFIFHKKGALLRLSIIIIINNINMGYYTTFSITKIKGSDEDFGLFLRDINKKTGLAFDKDTQQTAKWYDAKEDLAEVSKKYPDLLIEVFGEGEDSGDLWRIRYRGGDSETVGVQMPPFIVFATKEERHAAVTELFRNTRETLLRIICCETAAEKDENGVCVTPVDIKIRTNFSAPAHTHIVNILLLDNDIYFEIKGRSPSGYNMRVPEKEFTLSELFSIAELLTTR